MCTEITWRPSPSSGRESGAPLAGVPSTRAISEITCTRDLLQGNYALFLSNGD